MTRPGGSTRSRGPAPPSSRSPCRKPTRAQPSCSPNRCWRRCAAPSAPATSPLSLSVGIAAFPKHGASGGTLTQAATAAADAAKVLGSDRAVVFSAELDEVLAGDPGRELKEQRTHLSTVLSLAEVLELRDPRTASHSAAVGRYCELIAGELGFPRTVSSACASPGCCTTSARSASPTRSGTSRVRSRRPNGTRSAVIRSSPARILGARELADIREWILCRHEQPDGHGYPRGISGDSIPLESRVLAVAESYDAMTRARPYREPLAPRKRSPSSAVTPASSSTAPSSMRSCARCRAPRPSAASTRLRPSGARRPSAGLARPHLGRPGPGDPRLCPGRRRAPSHTTRRRAGGGFEGPVAPPAFAAVVCAAAVAAVIFDPEVGLFDPEIGLSAYRLVHKRQRFRWHRRVAGDELGHAPRSPRRQLGRVARPRSSRNGDAAESPWSARQEGVGRRSLRPRMASGSSP